MKSLADVAWENGPDESRVALGKFHDWLTHWLLTAAYPLWSTHGCDRVRGGFHERLSPQAYSIAEPRRARVQPRQVYAFALAPSLGWNGPSTELVAHGLDYFFRKYRRPDGLFITLVDAQGAPLDRSALLYDQACALLAFAAASGTSHLPFDVATEAQRLRMALAAYFSRAGSGYEAAVPARPPLQSNPHMHLFEASLAWAQVSPDSRWHDLAAELARIALTHFIHGSTLREFFDASWRPAAGIEGRLVEPGHQYEWAYLLLRWDSGKHDDATRVALRLIDNTERFGVHGGVAVNALLDDFSVHDASARLWPQTERLKAAAAAALVTGEQRYWNMALDAATSLREYLATPVAGLWYDRRLPSGEFVSEAAPASSLYHLVGACAQLRSLLTAKNDPRQAATERRT
jgi:mannose/cellobiose epimerase-like protein (N-acyl-D-glucosamine 2-epimerase family)